MSPSRLSFAVSLLLLSGCAIEEAARERVAAAREWRRPHVVRESHNSRRRATRIRQPRDLASLTLVALQQNPTVQAAVDRADAELERIPQVMSLDDPMLRLITRPEPIQTAAGDIVFTLGVSQKLPLPAKLDLKGRIAFAQFNEALEELTAARLKVIADVERAYYRIYVADRSIEITDSNLKLLEELDRVAQVQFEVGKASQSDALRVQTELSELENARRRLEGQRVSAVAFLNQLLDRPAGTAIASIPAVEPSALGTRVEALMAMAETHNPELAAFDHRIERDQHRVALADLVDVPDVTLGFEWNRGVGRTPFFPPINPTTGIRPAFNDASGEGDDNWAISVGLNVPVWSHRNAAAKREARARLSQTHKEKHAMRNLVAFRIHDACARAETLQDTIRLLQDAIIPQARQAYEVALPAFQGGTLDFLSVVDSWRQLLSLELMLHREVAQLQTILAELQREVGVSLVLPNDEQETTP